MMVVTVSYGWFLLGGWGLGLGFNLKELETWSLEEARPPPGSPGFHTLQAVTGLILPALQAA